MLTRGPQQAAAPALRDWRATDALLLPGVAQWIADGRWCADCGSAGTAPTHRTDCLWNLAQRIATLSPGGLFAVLALLANYDQDRLCAALDYVAEYERRRQLHYLQPARPGFQGPVLRNGRAPW